MNLATFIPIVQYFYWLFIVILILGSIIDYSKYKLFNLENMERFKQIENIYNIIYILAFSAFTTFFIVFYTVAGFILNFSFYFTLVVFGITAYSYANMLRDADSIKIKILVILPLVILYVIFYFFFHGDNIYKIAQQCKPTGDTNKFICKYVNGTYIGEAKAFMRHGEGTYTFHSGASYSGGWQNNLRHGTGITITKEGVKTTDEWKKGKKK